jgi:PAS domain S-box-containing protein
MDDPSTPQTTPRPSPLIGLVLAFGTLFATLGALLLEGELRERDRQRFARLADETRDEVTRRLEHCASLLRGAAAPWAVSEEVTAAEFQSLTLHWPIEREFPGVLGIAFVEHAPAGPEGGADRRQVRYAESLGPSTRSALDTLELVTGPACDQAAAWAVRSGGLALACVPQPDGDEQGRPLLLALHPVFRRQQARSGGVPGEIELLGFTSIAIDAARLLADVERLVDHEIGLTVHLGSDGDETLIDCCAEQNSGLTAAYSMAVGGQQFEFEVHNHPRFGWSPRTAVWLSLVCGLFITLLVSRLLRTVQGSAAKAQRLAAAMTADLSAAKAEAERLAMVAERTSDVVLLVGPDGGIRWVNEQFERITGYDLERTRGRTTDELLRSPNADPTTLQRLNAALREERPFHGQLQNRDHAQRDYWVEVDVQPLRDGEGRLTGYMLVESDVTAQVEARQALEVSHLAQRHAARLARVGYWELDLERSHLHWSEETRAIHEVPDDYCPTLEQAIGFYPGVAAKTIAAAVQAAIDQRTPWDVELPFVSAAGTHRWVRALGEPVIERDQVVRLRGAFQDVTEQRRARRRLETALAETRALRDALDRNTVYSVIDGSGRLVEVNDPLCELSGYRREELVGLPVDELRATHGSARWRELRAVLELGQRWHGEVALRSKQGDLLWFDSTVVPYHDSEGDRALYLSIDFEITERKQQEQRLAHLAQENQQLATAIATCGDAVLLTDGELRVQFANAAAFALDSSLGRPLELGATALLLRPEGRFPAPEVQQLREAAAQARPWRGRVPIAAIGQGSERELRRWVEVTMSPVIEQECWTGLVLIERDVTAVVDAEQVRETEARSAQARAKVSALLAADGELEMRLAEALEVTLHGLDRLRTTTAAVVLMPPGSDEPLLGPSCGQGPELRCVDLGELDWTPGGARALPDGRYHLSLCDDRACVGGLLLSVAEGQPLSPAELETLSGLAELMATAIQREQLSRELVRAREAAEAASRSKSEFLANMSHEIRTPMTAILGYAELLSSEGDGDDSPRARREAIETIQRNGDHLLALINDILDISKIEAGRMTVEVLPTPIERLVEEVLALMEVKARAKGLRLEARFETAVPCSVQTDPVRLRQILVNLIGNAIKFTEVGGVSLSVAHDEGRGELRLAVADTGIGLSPEELGRLFNAFGQADASTTRRYGGSGLGLQISRRLAQMLGGDVTVTSTLGQGSEFVASVATGPVGDLGRLPPGPIGTQGPLPEPAPALPRVPERSEAGQLQGRRILLAEDGLDNQRLLGLILRRAGAEVQVAGNGRRAVEAFTADGTVEGPLLEPLPFDLLLSDMQMPEMDGYTAVRTLRAKGLRLPVIALTAHAMSGDRDRCLEAGCDAYASKPVDRAELLRLCARLLAAPAATSS